MMKNTENAGASAPAKQRESTIIRTSVIGIGANILLVVFKAAVGIASNSVAILSDAANNLTDALSSVITIIGTKLANRAPDRKHPLGHGRIEYMSALIVSAIVLYAGVTALIESVGKILHPADVSYTSLSLIVMTAAIAVKIILGAYTKKVGKALNSGSLTASGEDASMDAILSASVLLSALVYIFFHINLEAWVGVLISVFIIRAGLEMISDAVNDMLGVRVATELSVGVRQTIQRFPGVHGVYDLLLNNYGPDNYIASVHIEVDDTTTASEIDALSRSLQAAVYEEHGVILGAVGIYSRNTGDDLAADIREDVRRRVTSREGVLQFHGFYLDSEKKRLTFDVILDFAVPDRNALYNEICQEIREAYPDYDVHVTLDIDISD